MHQPVLWIVHELMIKLEENGQVNVAHVTLDIINAISKHLKVHTCTKIIVSFVKPFNLSAQKIVAPVPGDNAKDSEARLCEYQC